MIEVIEYLEDKSIKILSCKVKEGFYLPLGHIIYSYFQLDDENKSIKRFKATQSGVIKQIHTKSGETVHKGMKLITLEPCSHPTVMRDMCAECGMDLRKLQTENESNNQIRNSSNVQSASVSMIHSIPDLRISMEQAQIIGKGDEERLLKQKKLVLLVDLDQTLIHTTNDNVPNNIKDVFHFQLWGHGSMWYHTRLRPKTIQFLESIEKLYELHICTFGTRSYAHTIARYLDPNGKYFSDRILSRDECFSQNSKTANLKELFPRGDKMVCIIDDREDVWNFAPNLIHVKPYHFFRHTGDINAPPGLTKQDQDDKTGFSFNKDGSTEEDKQQIHLEKEKPPPEAAPPPPVSSEQSNIREVTSDLSLSDEESCSGEKSEEANDGDKESEESSSSSATVDGDVKKAIPSELKIIDNKIVKEIVSTTTEIDEIKSVVPQTIEVKVEEAVSDTVEEIKSSTNESGNKQNELVEVEDPDDYLSYLEDILKSIHEAYYSLQSGMRGGGEVQDVKNVIPYVRRKVLKNVSIVFSGVVPTEVPLSERKNTRAYSVALSLGAQISEKIIPPNKTAAASGNELSSSTHSESTTHLVAARVGTAKVNEARRYKGIQIVTPDWLWRCSERWEKVDERLFQLHNNNNKNREIINSSSQRNTLSSSAASGAAADKSRPGIRKERTPSERFMDSINPLLSFSMDEIESMGHEVDDICNESESSSSSDENDDKNTTTAAARRRRSSKSHEVLNKESSSFSDSSTSISEGGEMLMRKRTRKRRRRGDDGDINNKTEETETTEEEPLNVKFRRGEPLPPEVEYLNLMNNATSDDEDDNNDDDSMQHHHHQQQQQKEEEEWMAQALEKEFLDDESSME